MICCNESYWTFFEQFLPHAVVGKVVWFSKIPWICRQAARIRCWGGAVARAPEGPEIGASLADRMLASEFIAREQVRCVVLVMNWAGCAPTCNQGEMIALKVGAVLSCPFIRAFFITRTPLSEVTHGMHVVWFVNVCVIATVVDQCMAVVGFSGLHAGWLVLDATCGLGSKWCFNAVPFFKQASGTERAAIVRSCVFAVTLDLGVALGEA